MRKKTITMLALLAALAAGCGGFQINSAWKQSEILVDGNDEEWADQQAVEQESVLLRARNDGKDLYLCLSSQARAVKTQIMGAFKQSFTVWFDPGNHHEKTLGLRVSYIPQEGRVVPDPGSEWDYLDSAQKQLAIVHGTEGEASPLQTGSTAIQCEARMNQGRLVVELKMPLRAEEGNPAGISTTAGSIISLCLETSPISQQVLDKARQAGQAHKDETPGAQGGGGGAPLGGGGMPGRGGGHHHGGGRGGSGGSGHRSTAESIPDAFEYWGVLKLAAK